MKKRQTIIRRNIDNRTLFISGLRSSVNAHDIRSHFTGCRKVVIKTGCATESPKYVGSALQAL